jgi:peptide/nickel transport system ATP-binding protein
MKDLQATFGYTYLFISHDLAVVRHVCDRIAVMDAGEIVELAATDEIFNHPQHEFTKKLLAASVHPIPPADVSGRALVVEEPAPAILSDEEVG